MEQYTTNNPTDLLTPSIPTNSLSVKSTTKERKITNQNIFDLNDIQRQLADIRTRGEAIQAQAQKVSSIEEAKNKQLNEGYMTRQEAMRTFGTDFTGVQMDENTGLFKGSEAALERSRGKLPDEYDMNQQIDRETNDSIAMLDSMRNVFLEANKNLIESIKQKYENRRVQMKDFNKSATAALRLMGIRSGREQFAPEIQAGILNAEERAGLQRLSELDSEESSLIAQAQIATTEKDFGILNSRMEQIREARREKQDLLDKQQRLAIDQERLILDKQNSLRETSKMLQEIGIKEAEFLAPSLLPRLEALGPDEEAVTRYITDYAEVRGVNAEYLVGALENYQRKRELEDLDVSTKKQSLRKGRLEEEKLLIDIENAKNEPMKKMLEDLQKSSDEFGKEFLQREEVQQFQIVDQSYSTINSQLEERTKEEFDKVAADNAASFAILGAYARMVKPDIAKMGESDQIVETQSILGLTQSTWERMWNDKDILTKKLIDVVNAADKQYNTRVNTLGKIKEDYQRRFKEKGGEDLSLPLVETQTKHEISSELKQLAEKKGYSLEDLDAAIKLKGKDSVLKFLQDGK